MPVILATQVVEIRRIAVGNQPGQIVLKTLSRKYPVRKKAGRVVQGTVGSHLQSKLLER
jgi:hypothetical protein